MASSRDEDDPGAKLGALLEPHLGALERPQLDATPEIEPAPIYLDEGELMALIFASLDHDNPRVCEGIDFDRLQILSEPADGPAPAPTVTESDGSTATHLAPEAELPRGATLAPRAAHPDAAPGLEPSEWVGRSWADDIKTVSGELLERPAPEPSWLKLRARAETRARDTLNLRHLDRATALRHLELFVHACRAKGHRLCRVITGKGIESAAEPVLKRAVVEWCLGAGEAPGPQHVCAWAPCLDRHGEWGALILELRARASAATKPP